MKRTILKLSDFAGQAEAILDASRAKWPGNFRMEEVDNDEGDPPGSDDDSGGDDDDDSDDDDADDKTGGSGDDKDDAKDKSGKDSDDDKVDRSEYDRVKWHRAAADRRNADLTAEVSRLQAEITSLKADGKKAGEPDTKTTARVSELEGTVQERDKVIQQLRINNAFLTANDYTWHDPEDAMRLADLSDVEIEEDGTVVGLKEALKALARSKPHLIKTPVKTDDKRGSSGSANNGKRKGDAKKPDRTALSKTYPVLATRR